jgi:RecA-family ATPase
MGEDGKFDMESDERILALPKANYAKAGGEIRLRYQEGYLAPVQLAGARAAAEQAERCQAAFLELLAWRTDAGLYLSPSKHSEHYAPAVCARYQKVQGRRYDFTRRDYEQALAEMFADGRLRVERNRRAERDEVVAVGRNLPKVRAEREKVVPTGPEFAGSPP